MGNFRKLVGQPISPPSFDLIGPRPFPASLSEYLLRRFSDSNKEKLFEEGSALFEVGDLPAGVFVVVEGRVKKFVTSPDGKMMVLEFSGPGSVIGLAANILGRPYAVTAEASHRTSAILVPRQELIREMQSNTAIAWQVGRSVSEDCVSMVDKLATVELSESASETIARCLLGLIDHSTNRNGQFVALGMSQETIAQMVGLSRETVSRQISKWRRKGVLDWTRSGLLVRNWHALEGVADTPNERLIERNRELMRRVAKGKHHFAREAANLRGTAAAFIETELESLALFVRLARAASKSDARIRHIRNARKARDRMVRFSRLARLSKGELVKLARRLGPLEVELRKLTQAIDFRQGHALSSRRSITSR